MKKFVYFILISIIFSAGHLIAQIKRTKIIENAIPYIQVQWYCTEKNINHAEYLQYGGQPCDFSVGWQTAVAYSYGGNDDVPKFLDRIAKGDGAGSHLSHYNAAGGTPWWATGIDCSAFVSRCWEISRQSTRTLPNFSTEVARTDLLSGDILNKPASHVRLFDKRAADGRPIVYEASGSATKCVYRAVDWSDYTPMRFNELMIAAPHFRVENPGNRQIKISWTAVTHATQYQIFFSTDGIAFSDMGETSLLSQTYSNQTDGRTYYFRIMGKNDQGELGILSEVLGTRVSAQQSSILIVNGFDRMTTDSNTRNYVIQHAKALAYLGLNFDSCSNEAVAQNQVNLRNYSIVIWILGEESTADQTFSLQEQNAVMTYLENGGKLFVSGAEIGWDLDHYNNGLTFYHDYLKARYVADDATVYQFSGVSGSIFEGLNGMKFDNGSQGTYNVDWPDCIEANGGSKVCLNYDGTAYHAAIQYEGKFGSSMKTAKLVYLAFPFETIYPEANRNKIMERVVQFFTATTSANNVVENVPAEFQLRQNYPNPFNSLTTIQYQLPQQSQVELVIFNLIGEKVTSLVNENQASGWHQVIWDGTNEGGAKVASGIYLYQLKMEGHIETRRMMLAR